MTTFQIAIFSSFIALLTGCGADQKDEQYSDVKTKKSSEYSCYDVEVWPSSVGGFIGLAARTQCSTYLQETYEATMISIGVTSKSGYQIWQLRSSLQAHEVAAEITGLKCFKKIKKIPCSDL